MQRVCNALIRQPLTSSISSTKSICRSPWCSTETIYLIYSTANSDKSNALKLHETNYFIWSNKASMSHNTKLSAADAAYTSSNYFMAQAAQQMNARVSPYLALLDNLHAQIPAMSRPSTSNGTLSASGADLS